MSEPCVLKTIPRHRLRPKFCDLRDGDKGWANGFDIRILADGTAFINQDGMVVRFAGSQPWPDHNQYGDFLVERQGEEYRLHVFGDNVFSLDRPEDAAEPNFVQFATVVDHGHKWATCQTCHGSGIVQLPSNTDAAE